MAAAPIWLQTANAAAAATGVSPDIPSLAMPGDLLILFVETADQAMSAPSGWTELTGSPSSSTGNTRLTAFYRRYEASDGSTVSVGDSGDHQFAVVLAFRGCALTGDPTDVVAAGSGSGTTVTAGGVTTTEDNCLIVTAVARDSDLSTAQFSAWTNANLASITERQDQGTTSGNGGGTGIATGVKATAGATGDTTATLANTANWAYLTIALKPGGQPFVFDAPGMAASAGNQTYNWPTGHLSGDVALIIIETANETATAPSGWAHVDNSPQGTGTAGAAGATAINVLWKRATSGAEAGATVTSPGDHQIGNIYVFRGCAPSGNPWDVTAGSAKATASTSTSIGGVTTTEDEALVLYIATRDNDLSGANFSAWSNGTIDYGGVKELVDGGSTSGNGGGLAIAVGVKQTAGATGTTTATSAVSTVEGNICIALIGGGAAAVVTRAWGYIIG